VLLGLAGIVLLAALGWQLLGARHAQPQRERTGLFTTLPILWNESADLARMLAPDEQPHWAKAAIAHGGKIVPLDTLAASALKPLQYLVMAQPRPLSPDENVALDGWVRGGGKLLLFADPMLTEDTVFALGDKRRPQDIVMLDPILKHWGLRLEFDSEDEFQEGPTRMMGMTVPINMPGRLIAEPPQCKAWDDGYLATCQIGQGRVVVLADAAVLERNDSSGVQGKALDQLLDAAFLGR
jgi:hypothetical protein